jgi:DNA-binding GntR family transcriptional regulator
LAIERAVLRDQVKEILLERILSGHYRPEDRLVETRIAKELGTSQAPVREALRELELLRFVESAPFRGSWVRAVSEEELSEIYPVRAAIEEVAARAAAVRLDGEVADLEAEIEAMRNAADLHEQVEHDVQFHRLIVEASRNRTLAEVWASLRVEARTVITAVKTGIDRKEIAEMHVPIVDALRERDPEKAGRAIREHVEHFGELLVGGRT